MVNVTETNKFTKIFVGGQEIVVNTEDTIKWTQIKVETNGKEVTLNEGDNVRFVTDSEELKEGIISKLSGKKEKTRITVTFTDGHEETWSICSIKDNSIVNLNDNEDNEEAEDEE